MIIAAYAVIAFAALSLVICIWVLIQNSKTHVDRRLMIDAIGAEYKRRIRNRTFYDPPNLWDLLEGVPYNNHMRARILLRDPWALYPDVLRALPKAPGVAN